MYRINGDIGVDLKLGLRGKEGVVIFNIKEQVILYGSNLQTRIQYISSKCRNFTKIYLQFAREF